MATDYQYAVIGAGVVGLATAAELAPRGATIILEKESKFGQGISSRNSEVVHAGLYYQNATHKARLCVEGNRLIEKLAGMYGFGYSKVGKYIVATSEDETDYLKWLKGNAEANGVNDLYWVPPSELLKHEPAVRAVTCLYSPSSGIVDSHGLMTSFKTRAEQANADFVFNAEVVALRKMTEADAYEITVRDHDGGITGITATSVINCAGLYADRLAAMVGLDVQALGLELFWARGHYYMAENSFGLNIKHLVYPVPDKTLKSLGIHATVDLQGGLRFGPTAEYMPQKIEDYTLPDVNADFVAQAISRYLPGAERAQFSPIMAGIRPKLSGPGEPPRDFYIQEESIRGLPGFVNLVGIESPGLTAAPAIAKYVSRLVD